MSVCIDVVRLPHPSSGAVGDEAKEIQREEESIDEEILRAVLSGAKLRSSLRALATAVSERRFADWDGYGAKPASISSMMYAIGLLKRLPPEAPEPDISIDPDGEVALEWHRAPRLVFSVSVGPLGELTYAGLFGGSKVHGVETHMGDAIPRAIRAGIQRVYA
ncbi:MAG: hypothetical protein AABO58_14400 [Acidobacteriota bacterium]